MIFDPLRQGRSGGMPEFGPRGSPYPPGYVITHQNNLFLFIIECSHPPGARFDPVGPLNRPPFRPPSRPPGQPRRDMYG